MRILFYFLAFFLLVFKATADDTATCQGVVRAMAAGSKLTDIQKTALQKEIQKLNWTIKVRVREVSNAGWLDKRILIQADCLTPSPWLGSQVFAYLHPNYNAPSVSHLQVGSQLILKGSTSWFGGGLIGSLKIDDAVIEDPAKSPRK